MARVVNNSLMKAGARERTLSTAELRRATEKLERKERRHPRRLVRLACHGWMHDLSAVTGDWLWCEPCADLRMVEEVQG